MAASPLDEAISWLSSQLNAPIINFVRPATFECLSHLRVPNRWLVPYGAYAFDVWHLDDDIHLVCLTEESPQRWADAVLEVLDIEANKDVTALRSTDHILDLTSEGLSRDADGRSSKFWALWQSYICNGCILLHYAALTDRRKAEPRKMSHEVLPAYSAARTWSKNLDMVRDMQQFGLRLEEMSIAPSTIIQCHREIRQWLSDRGLFGAKTGFFDAESVLWIIYRAILGLSEHANYDKNVNALLVSNVLASLRMPLVVLTPTGLNVTAKMPSSTNRAIRNAVEGHALSEMAQTGELPGPPYGSTFWSTNGKYCYQFYVECWHTSASQRRYFLDDNVPHQIARVAGYLEQKQYPVRVWPVSLHRSSERDCVRRYLIALEGTNVWMEDVYGADSPMNFQSVGLQRMEALKDKILTDVIDSFQSAHIDVSTLSRKETDALFATFSSSPSHSHPLASQAQVTHTSASESENENLASKKLNSESASTAPTKFRTARDAISRLRYDDAHAGIDYDVGYLDRFAGIMWMRLAEWGGKETEEDDFIPTHRVKIIRRNRDQKVVWERDRRKDLTGDAG